MVLRVFLVESNEVWPARKDVGSSDPVKNNAASAKSTKRRADPIGRGAAACATVLGATVDARLRVSSKVAQVKSCSVPPIGSERPRRAPDKRIGVMGPCSQAGTNLRLLPVATGDDKFAENVDLPGQLGKWRRMLVQRSDSIDSNYN
ncbi:unnamed protein product [Protopolystoma xenopodis]|uniref:Uncharacterized protein n=1 Tax=Protopolystoma xenopodis TaxID=117903 RepID=A0A448WYP0_9PLAT|nr:unnamed protein product [Protopolystoma xenopodis]